MKHFLFSFCLLYALHAAAQQTNTSNIITSDIANFWNAYDSVLSTQDTSKQLQYIDRLYISKASLGLVYYRLATGLTVHEMRDKIVRYPKFWASIKPYTLHTESVSIATNAICNQFRKIYPGFFEPSFYFLIGTLKAGGKAQSDVVAIGIELEASNFKIDCSELPYAFQQVLQLNKNCSFVIAHECVHIQQTLKNRNPTLLAATLSEGAANFIASVITGEVSTDPYMNYGQLHEKEIWNDFKPAMLGVNTGKWLWNLMDTSILVHDLGYFVGYAICKSYYDHSTNKQTAIQEIIEIDYSSLEKLILFLKQSRYEETLNAKAD